MTRQLLPHDVASEDRSRGCLWASTFRRPGDEVQKLGTIGGAPVVNRGVTLDGAADYILYNLWGQFANEDPWSCHCIFYPDFATSENADRRVFATNAGNYSLWKRNNASANTLLIAIGGTVIAQITEATYTGLWVVGGRNLITVAGTSGATDAWLNGTQILTADASAWTPTDDAQLAIGSNVGGTNNFDGRIEMLKFYGTYLQSAESHQALWEGGGA